MQDRDYNLMKHISCGLVVVAGVGFLSISHYLSSKSDYETRAGRTQAVTEFMNSEGFKDYAAKRIKFVEGLHDRNPSEGKGTLRTRHVTEVLEATLGKFEPGDFDF